MPIAMPVINQLRLLVIHYFKQTYGENWLFAAILNVSSNENNTLRPLYGSWDAELYHLKLVLENQAHQSMRAAELLPALRLAYSLRNKLAYYTPIELQEYFELMEQVHNLGGVTMHS